MRLWVCGFVNFPVCKLMCSGFIGLSWVYKPVSLFVLHFVYERSVYLGLQHKDNIPLSIYRDFKSLDDFGVFYITNVRLLTYVPLYSDLNRRRSRVLALGE